MGRAIGLTVPFAERSYKVGVDSYREHVPGLHVQERRAPKATKKAPPDVQL